MQRDKAMLNFDRLRQMQENLNLVLTALHELDRTPCLVNYHANDAEDVQRAIGQMEAIIDERLRRFRSHVAIRSTIDEMASAMKASCRRRILRVVEEQRGSRA